MRRLPVYRGVVAQLHPQFPAGSKAITPTETNPVDISAPKITYDAADDAAIDDYHRLNGLFISILWVSERLIDLLNSIYYLALSKCKPSLDVPWNNGTS